MVMCLFLHYIENFFDISGFFACLHVHSCLLAFSLVFGKNSKRPDGGEKGPQTNQHVFGRRADVGLYHTVLLWWKSTQDVSRN